MMETQNPLAFKSVRARFASYFRYTCTLQTLNIGLQHPSIPPSPPTTMFGYAIAVPKLSTPWLVDSLSLVLK